MTAQERKDMTDLTIEVRELVILIKGNGGSGIFKRLELLEKWRQNFWIRTATVAFGTAAVFGMVFKGFELLGRSQGWW